MRVRKGGEEGFTLEPAEMLPAEVERYGPDRYCPTGIDRRTSRRGKPTSSSISINSVESFRKTDDLVTPSPQKLKIAIEIAMAKEV